MRLNLILLAAATALGASTAQAQSDAGVDRGIDIRGYDEADRTPDWNYRRGEVDAKGAYYDAGRYGPRGLLVAGAESDTPSLNVLSGSRRSIAKADGRQNVRRPKNITAFRLPDEPRR